MHWRGERCMVDASNGRIRRYKYNVLPYKSTHCTLAHEGSAKVRSSDGVRVRDS